MSRIVKLPAGYRQVEYIESSGTQYIDTGFMPNGNTRVLCDFQLTRAFDESRAVFGARTSGTSQLYVLFHIGSNSFRNDYYNNIEKINVANELARMIVDKNKNVTTLDGNTQTYTAVTTATTCTMLLFAANYAGKVDYLAYAKIYSCQIYDNGTLIRDYVPCINPSGEAGLYDLVYGVFYGNAGTGVFAVGRNVYSEDEITKLEYVESTGEQYVDTEFKPNQDSSIIMDIAFNTTATQAAYGARTSASSKANTLIWMTNGYYRFYYNNGYSNFTNGITDSTVRHTIKQEKNVLTIGDAIFSRTYAAFQCDYNLYLFAHNAAGEVSHPASAKIYSCQIYDNGPLIRDYYPATADGEVGLWDACSGVLYTSGSGTALVAGPEIETAPSTPSDLEILDHTDTSVTLGWSEVANAFGYRVYKNGSLYSDQTATEFSDEVTPYQSAEYGVSAYNDKGESKTALLAVYISPDNPIPYLITDRAQTDADRVAALALMDYESMSDTERAEWDSDLKGAYNASDLNRVESAVAYLAETLRILPIELRKYAENLDVGWDKYFDVPYGSDAYSVITKENWTLKDVPTPADMERYLANVLKLRNALKFASDALPQTMNDLRWQGANAIESALKNLDTAIALFKENTQIMIVNTAGAWAFSGEVFMGEV